MKDKSKKKLIKQVKKLIEEYLNRQVIEPSHETIDKDAFALDRLGTILVILDASISSIMKNGIEFDKQGSTNKIWLSYLAREINFIVVSILSGSYLSANILMRSNFELLISILFKMDQNKIKNLELRDKINMCSNLTKEEKEKIIALWEKDENSFGMGKKINNISYLTDQEKKNLKRQWGRLSNWVHFSKEWEKKICPIFLLHKPMYHPALCKDSIEELEGLIDLLLVTAILKYEVDVKIILSVAEKYRIDLSNFTLITNRIEVRDGILN